MGRAADAIGAASGTAKKPPASSPSGAKSGGTPNAADEPAGPSRASQAKELMAAATRAAVAHGLSAAGVPPVASKWIARHLKPIIISLLAVLFIFIGTLAATLAPLGGFFASGGNNQSNGSLAAACSAAASVLTSSTASTGPTPPANELSLMLAAIRWQESRNNYQDSTSGATWDPQYAGGTLPSGYAGAFGAYQWIQNSWYSEATAAGLGFYASQNPATISPIVAQSVQDQVAAYEIKQLYDEKLHFPGGPWLWVAESWYDPAYAGPGLDGHFPGQGNTLTVRQYGESVLNYASTQPWLAQSNLFSPTTSAGPNANALTADLGCGNTTVSGPLASRVVQIAQSQIGKSWSQAPTPGAWGPSSASEEWCSYFASWVMRTAGVTPSPGALGYSGDLWQWAGSHGGQQLEPTATPQPGDLVFFGTGYDNGGSAHVAIVSQVLPSGQIVVIGGNQATGSNGQATVSQSDPFYPADAAASGWPGPIWAYAAVPGL